MNITYKQNMATRAQMGVIMKFCNPDPVAKLKKLPVPDLVHNVRFGIVEDSSKLRNGIGSSKHLELTFFTQVTQV